MAPAGGTHGIICMKLGTALSLFVEANNLGAVFGAETGFIVERDPDTVLGADIAFVSHERLRGVENNGVSALCGVRRLLPAASSVARLA
jgi:Uma2 family endonuclease